MGTYPFRIIHWIILYVPLSLVLLTHDFSGRVVDVSNQRKILPEKFVKGKKRVLILGYPTVADHFDVLYVRPFLYLPPLSVWLVQRGETLRVTKGFYDFPLTSVSFLYKVKNQIFHSKTVGDGRPLFETRPFPVLIRSFNSYTPIKGFDIIVKSTKRL